MIYATMSYIETKRNIKSYMVLDFKIQSLEHSKGRYLEITISEECITNFRNKIKEILGESTPPEYKVRKIKNLILDFVEKIRHARSGLPQVEELRVWLAGKLRKLAGATIEAKFLPQFFVNHWIQRVDSHLYIKTPNFFLNPSQHDEKTYIKFFSPYREA